MPASHAVMEFVGIFFGLLMLWHAYRQGLRWLSTCVWAMFFGVVIEFIFVLHPDEQCYTYGTFTVMLGRAGKQVPLWVGMGWGAIVYCATLTAQRLRQRWWLLRPATAGVLAVNIDLSLDPIAHRLGFWTWNGVRPPDYYGVPFDNFLGWFLIVSTFALCVRALFRWIPPTRRLSWLWVPPLGGLVAVGMTLGANSVLQLIYKLPHGQTAAFVVVFGIAGAVAWFYRFHSRRATPKDYVLLSLPLGYHVVAWIMLLATMDKATPGSLIVAIAMNFVVGFFAYGWAMFVQPVQAPSPAPGA